MQFKFGNKIFSARWWTPSVGKLGTTVAFDTETEVASDGAVPRYVLGQAFAGGSIVWLIKLTDLLAFFDVHKQSVLVAHNAPFDICVVEQEVGFNFDEQIRSQKFFDTGLLFCLYELATKGRVPRQWKLDITAKHLLGVVLPKNDDIRLTFGQYRSGNTIRYSDISPEHIEYACKDPIATYCCFVKLYDAVKKLDPKFFLSHKLQLMGAYGLHKISLQGIGFDLSQKKTFLGGVDSEIESTLKTLKSFGYIPGQKGVNSIYEKNIKKLGIDLPKTDKGKISRKAEFLQLYRQEPFIDALLTYEENRKLKSFVVNLTIDRVHTNFRPLVNTGRTSSWGPNLQNLPRRVGVRECFIPATGYTFLIIDYSQLELCTLAQVCIDQFGFSKMAELINNGVDLHTWFGGVIADRKINKDDDERQWAKAANFGFPGGLGIPRFRAFAKKTYGISLNEQQARKLKDQWLSALPEMSIYLEDTLSKRHDFSSIGDWCDPRVAPYIFKRIIAGKLSKAGKEYSSELKQWAFETVLPEVASHLAGITEGSEELLSKILKEAVATRTGRVRANATYCQVRNSSFQGLAADGAKIALYRIVQAKYRVVNFVHDEFIIEVPINVNLEATARNVENIMITAMRTVVPDVLIKTEWTYSDRWYKKSKIVRDENGTIQVYSRKTNDASGFKIEEATEK